MMHGRGKSDPVVVAVKPANKAERSAAESVEPRAGTKGNASQQSTCRAQNRESVSQALERIRQAARQRKKETFTSLTNHISTDLLRMAFLALKKDAAPGVDGLTWRTYEADLDRNLTDLDALFVGINSKKVNYILDTDTRSFFDSVSQSWVVRFLEHRIADSRIIRLI